MFTRLQRKHNRINRYVFKLSEHDALTIVHGIDFASMELANHNTTNSLYAETYRRTKKDVFEYKFKTAKQALLNINVIKFTALHETEICIRLHDYNFTISNYRIFKKYVDLCKNFTTALEEELNEKQIPINELYQLITLIQTQA